MTQALTALTVAEAIANGPIHTNDNAMSYLCRQSATSEPHDPGGVGFRFGDGSGLVVWPGCVWVRSAVR